MDINRLESVLKRLLEPIDEKLSLINEDVKELKSDVSTLKEEVSVLKSDVSILKDDVSALSKKIDVQHRENVNADNVILKELRNIGVDIVFVNRRVADTELKMHRLE